MLTYDWKGAVIEVQHGTGKAIGYFTKWCIYCGAQTYHTSGGCTECHKKPHLTTNKSQFTS